MSIPLSTIKETIRTIVINATGYASNKVIFANQNAPKPQKPYITINPVLTVTNPFLEDMEEDAEQTTVIRPVRDILASIHGFGSGSLLALSDIMTYLSRFQGVELLRNNNLGLINRDRLTIKDLSYDIDDNLFVEHSMIELELQCQESDIIDDTYPGASEVQVDIDVAFDGPNTNDSGDLFTLTGNIDHFPNNDNIDLFSFSTNIDYYPNSNTDPAIITLNKTITGTTESSYDGLNPPVNIVVTDITYQSFVLDFEEG